MHSDTPSGGSSPDAFVPRMASDPLAQLPLPSGGPDDSPEAQRAAERAAIEAAGGMIAPVPVNETANPTRHRMPSSASMEFAEPTVAPAMAAPAAPAPVAPEPPVASNPVAPQPAAQAPAAPAIAPSPATQAPAAPQPPTA
ncbi:MAG: hypothetical protein JHD16_06470, partial [Solirubrobacteraceae bacterium]|nr:hypothetical protein [Solirubrobacteraceae bacterium]